MELEAEKKAVTYEIKYYMGGEIYSTTCDHDILPRCIEEIYNQGKLLLSIRIKD